MKEPQLSIIFGTASYLTLLFYSFSIKEILIQIYIHFCLLNSSFGNRYDILWWPPCSNSIKSPIRFSAFVNMHFFLTFAFALYTPASWFREHSMEPRLYMNPSGMDTAPGFSFHWSYFSSALLLYSTWGYCTADLRISSRGLIVENIVWPRLVKVKPTVPGTGRF